MNEVRIADEIRVDATIAVVWRAIDSPTEQAGWHPFLTGISGNHELGQVRTCSVVVGRKRGETRERCVEREDGRHIVWEIEQDSTGFGRMVSGWRAGFALRDQHDATIVTAQSAFQPNNLLVRAMLPVIRRKFHQTQQAILRALKESLESSSDAVATSASRSQP
jgi:Polyketide cyclase / dehydrase and lipid transport